MSKKSTDTTTHPASPSASVSQPRSRRRWFWRLLGVLFLLSMMIGGALVMDAWEEMGRLPSGERLERIEDSPNYVDGKFVNSLPSNISHLKAIWAWFSGGSPTRVPKTGLPVQKRSADEFKVASLGVRSTWFGHSSMLLEIEGRRFLTDPVWSAKTAPSILGTARFFEAPISLEELPPLDAIIISHDHFDHLDMPTIQQLEARSPTYVVPLGIGEHLEYWGVDPERIIELDWWESTEIGGIRLVATPARHGSGRSMRGTNKTLWSSWAFVGTSHRVYFSGDTGMFPGFKEIGERLGPFDLTLIESGAYHETWSDEHLGPEQAVQAHIDLRGEVMQPIHWGTFDLALHGWTEPVERLMVAAEKAGVQLVIPRPGESVDASSPEPLVRWWPEHSWDTVEEHSVASSGL